MDPMLYNKRAHGLGMWIAFWPRDTNGKPVAVEVLAAQLLALGVTWVAMRVGDTKFTDYTPAAFEAMCKVLRSFGLASLPWYYSRPTFYLREVGLVKELLEMGADGVIIDAEIEWSERGDPMARPKAKDYGERLRAAVGDAYIAHAPLAWLAYHRNWPFEEFGTFVDQVMPQSYWSELKHGQYSADFVSNCLEAWEAREAAGDIVAKGFAPIGVTYGRREMMAKGMPAKTAPPGDFDPKDLERFFERYEDPSKAPGGVRRTLSLYSFESAAPSAFDVMSARLARLRESETSPLPSPEAETQPATPSAKKGSK